MPCPVDRTSIEARVLVVCATLIFCPPRECYPCTAENRYEYRTTDACSQQCLNPSMVLQPSNSSSPSPLDIFTPCRRWEPYIVSELTKGGVGHEVDKTIGSLHAEDFDSALLPTERHDPHAIGSAAAILSRASAICPLATSHLALPRFYFCKVQPPKPSIYSRFL